MTKSISSTGLSIKAVESIQRVFSKYPEIESVRLYGSRAKGNFQNGSDIDLTIMSGTMNYLLLAKIENELDDLLLPYKIDLSIFREISNIDLVNHIKRVGFVFYQKNA